MKKKILIASFDLAIGGVERSLIGLLNQIDYKKYEVDLMLFKHEGEFLPFVHKVQIYWLKFHLIQPLEIDSANSERRLYPIAITRIIAKYMGSLHGN